MTILIVAADVRDSDTLDADKQWPHTIGVFIGNQTPSPPIEVSFIPQGWKGTEITIERMAKLASDGGRDPRVRLVAAKIIGRDLPPRAYNLEAARLLRFVQKHVRYTLDPRGLEWVQKPLYTLEVGQGDCDDASTLFCSLMLAMGHACGFRAVKVDAARPEDFSHVYSIVQTKTGGSWQAADASDTKFALGAIPEHKRKLFGAKMWAIHAQDGRAIPLR